MIIVNFATYNITEKLKHLLSVRETGTFIRTQEYAMLMLWRGLVYLCSGMPVPSNNIQSSTLFLCPIFK